MEMTKRDWENLEECMISYINHVIHFTLFLNERVKNGEKDAQEHFDLFREITAHSSIAYSTVIDIKLAIYN